MANKNFNIGLTFNANTQQAKQQIRELKGALEGLTSSSLDKIGTDKFTSKVAKATSAVADLQGKLNAAINTDTGRLDLNKFTQSLQASGKTLKDYQQQFTALGSQGEKAFLQVSKAIANAEIPAQRTNAVIEKLWNSLKNVATWQLSSTILNSFTASLQEAYQYAQDLNKNLNDIRIVTGYGADEMDRFAVSANDAAKKLSTTTNEYVKASLIYFQQGLSSQEVKKRTDATIKLANVTGESATTVSEWMTAIWNNFDNGSKSLEYYADVLTKLGAATASSSDEIAGGLEKFAAIAETVGLSYEYAATALATITAQTRQSEDVVGTGLRTIFSRLQSLSLGEALEDGTDLTKYSQALETVGINIKTASGDLRDMDDILNDLGARWEQLGRDQQNALAQTVGGVRQYTNLIALMDNWDVFKNNLSLAESSTGELTRQNEIYAESWEAANNRIKASMEDLYNSIVEDDVFITLTNGAADFIEIVDNMIDSLGGLKTLLPGVLAIMTKMFSDKMILGARSISTNYKEQLQAQQKNFAELRVKSAKQYEKGVVVGDTSTSAEMVEATGKVREASFEAQALSIKRELTAEEKNLITSISTEIQQQNELLVQARKRADNRREEAEAAKKATDQAKEESEKIKTLVEAHQKELQILQKKKEAGKLIKKEEKKRLNVLEKELNTQEQLTEQVKDLSKQQKNVEEKAERAQEQFDEIEKTTNEIAENGEKIVKDMSKPKLGESIMNLTQSLTSMAFALSSIFNLWDVLTDPDVSGWEKFTTTFTTLIPLIISAKSAITSFGKVNMQTINESTGKLLTNMGAWIKNKIAIDKNKKSRDENAKAADNSEKEIEEENNAIKENNIQTAINTELKKDNKGREYTETSWTENGHTYSIREFVGSNKKSYFIDGSGKTEKGKSKTVLDSLDRVKKTDAAGEVVGEAVEGAVEQGAKNASEQSTSLLANLKGNLKAAGPWLAFAAAVALLVTTIKAAIAYYNRFEAAVKSAEQGLMAQQKAMEKVSEETKNLRANIDDYSNGLNNLDKLVKGTREYKEALTETNKAAMELIKNHKGLKYEIKDGVIDIDEDSLEKAYDDQLNQQLATQNQYYASQMNVNNTKMTRDRVNIARDINSGWEGEGYNTTAATTTVAGAGVATLGTLAVAGLVNAWNPAGWAFLIAAGVGAVVAGVTTVIAEESAGVATSLETEALEHLENLSEDERAAILADKSKLKDYLTNKNDGKYADLADSFSENVDAIRSQVEASNLLKEEQELLRESVAANTVAILNLNSEDEEATARGVAEQWQEDKKGDVAAYGMMNDLLAGLNEQAAILINNTVLKDSGTRIENWAGDKATLYDTEGNQIGASNTYSYDTMKAELGRWIVTQIMTKDKKDIIAEMTRGQDIENTKIITEWINTLPTKEDYLKEVRETNTKNAGELNRLGITDQTTRSMILEKAAGDDWDDLNFEFLNAEEIAKLRAKVEHASGEMADKIKTALTNYETAVRNSNYQQSVNFNLQEYKQENKSDAMKAMGMDNNQFEAYAKSLAEARNMTEEFAEIYAVNTLKTTAGVAKLDEALGENLVTFRQSTEGTIDYANSLGKITDSLEKWLGVTELSTDVVADFITDGTLEAAIQGQTDAIKKIYKAGAQAFIDELPGLGNSQEALSTFTDNAFKTDIKLGASISSIEGFDQVLESLANKELDVKDVLKTVQMTGFQAVGKTFETTLQSIYEGKKDVKDISFDPSQIMYAGLEIDSAKLKKIKKAQEDAIERYWSINKQLELSETRLNRISKASDRAFGAAKIAGLKAYRGELANNNALLASKLELIEFYISKDYQAVLELGLNITIDENGIITNYREALDGLTGDALENAKKKIEKYQESLTLWQSTQDQIIDNNYEIEDTLLEEIDVAVNFDVDAAEFALSRIERALDRIEDKAFSAAEAISLMADQMEPNLKKIEAAEKGIEEIFKKNGLDGLNLEELNARLDAGQVSMNEADIEKLKKYYDTIEETRDAVMELHQSMHDKLIAAVDEFSEKIKEQTNLLEHYNSILKNHENIIGLIGKANLGINNDLLKQINQKQVEIARTQLDAATQTKNALANDLALAEQTLAQKRAEGADEETIRLWENTVNEIREKANKAESEYFSALNASLEAAADAFKANVEMIAEEFSKAVSSVYGTIEKMREAFDRQQKISKKFLQDYEKTYEISKLNRNITNSIDNTKNLKAQQQLAGLAAELNAYSIEGREMSKIDLEYMQKKYDLMVAQIALEEAQNAKNQVRLTRDSSGSWGYVYTANEQATDKAAQSFEDKRYAMEQFMANTEVNLTQEMLTLQEEYQTKITELADKYGKDSKEFKTESAKLAQQYTEDLDYIITQYTNLTDRGAADARKWGLQVAEDFRSTLLGSIYPTYDSFTALQNDTNMAVMKALSDLNEEYDLFSQNQSEAMSSAGLSMDNYAEDVQNAYDTVTKGEQAVKDSIDALVKKHEEEMPKASQAVADWESAWDTYLKEIRNNEYWSQIGGQIDLLISKWSSFVNSVGGYTPPEVNPNGKEDKDPSTGPTLSTTPQYIVSGTRSGNGHTFYGLSTIDEEGNASDDVRWISNADFNKYATATGNSVMPNNFGSSEEYETYTIDTLGVNYRTEDQVDEMTTAKREKREREGKILAYIKTDTPTDGYYNQYLVKSGNEYFAMAPGAPSVSTPDDGYTVKFKASDLSVYRMDRDQVINTILGGMAEGYGKNKLEYMNIKNLGLNGSRETLDDYGDKSYNVDLDYNVPDNARFIVGQTGTGYSSSYGGYYGLHTNFTPYKLEGTGLFGMGRGTFMKYLRFDDELFSSILKASSFDTGGYTGNWGPEGKLAVLHQKEIILNAQDTENFLTAIQIVRSLSDKLERNALLAHQGLGNITASSNLSLGGDTLEQHVTITAEFPNVVDHNEIQEAFNTLVNQASQYANR